MTNTEPNTESLTVEAGVNDNVSTSNSTTNYGTEPQGTHEKLENYGDIEKHEIPDNEGQIPTADEILNKLPVMPERSTKDQLSSIVLCFSLLLVDLFLGSIQVPFLDSPTCLTI